MLTAVSLYNMILAQGFKPSDYFRDMGKSEIYLYAKSEEWPLFSAVISSFFHDPESSALVTAWLSDIDVSVSFTKRSWFGEVAFSSFSDASLSPGTTLVMLSSSDADFIAACHERGLRVMTFRKFSTSAFCYHYLCKPILEKLREVPDIHIVCCDLPVFPEQELPYLSDNERWIRSNSIHYRDVRKKLNNGAELSQCFRGFEGFPYNDAESVLALLATPPSSVGADGALHFHDYKSTYVNIRDGHRVNPVEAVDPKRTLFMFGGCRVMGFGSPDDKTPSALLQGLFNDHSIRVNVQDYAYLLNNRHRYVGGILRGMPLQPGDILLLGYNVNLFEFNRFKIPYSHIDLRNLFQRPHNYGEVLFDDQHFTENGNQAIAYAIHAGLSESGLLEDVGCENDRAEFARLKQQSASTDDDKLPYGRPFRDYLGSLRRQRLRIGSIVMNCNPFTKGHRYLIDYASSQVDHLYVFAVEEDKSDFKFVDRFRLISEGTKDLQNVTVIPSGQFIISSLTFNDYFGKSDLQDQTIDPSGDVELFAKFIAPQLDISVRFAGEEPLDRITEQYNQTMARILPEYGIEFREIKRKEQGGGVISASRVRKLLETKDWDGIAELVPPTTLSFLQNEWQKPETVLS